MSVGLPKVEYEWAVQDTRPTCYWSGMERCQRELRTQLGASKKGEGRGQVDTDAHEDDNWGHDSLFRCTVTPLVISWCTCFYYTFILHLCVLLGCLLHLLDLPWQLPLSRYLAVTSWFGLPYQTFLFHLTFSCTYSPYCKCKDRGEQMRTRVKSLEKDPSAWKWLKSP